jgi:4a-hydroxytetrahydrobiopterin dehydratase
MSLLSDSEVERLLASVPQWRSGARDGEGGEGGSIVRELAFADFAQAIAFVNRVAQAAEAADHHPDILLHGWNKVRLTLSTHSQGGLTDADFQLASQLDRLA